MRQTHEFSYEDSTDSLFNPYAFPRRIVVRRALGMAKALTPEKGERATAMSTIQEVNAEQLAKLFHNYCEALSHDGGIHESEASSWETTPQSERKLKVAAARLTLLELSAMPAESQPGRKYYAKAGQAEWGCQRELENSRCRIAQNRDFRRCILVSQHPLSLYEFFMNF